MHDIKFIRDHTDVFVETLARRPAYASTARQTAVELLAKDEVLRALQTDLQQKQARRNEASKLIGKAKAQKNNAEADALMAEVGGLKDAIQQGEQRERELQDELRNALAVIPNLPEADVPDGEDERANVPVPGRGFGMKPNLGTNNPKEHFDLGEALKMMDFERAAKVSGARFVYLKSGLAKLSRALTNFMLDTNAHDFGYIEVNPPLMVRNDAFFGTGQLPKFEEDLFFTDPVTPSILESRLVEAMNQVTEPEGGAAAPAEVDLADEQYAELVARRNLETFRYQNRFGLIPTAEISLTNYVSGEILDEAELPIRFTAYTPCFRSEAGAAGKDTRGMIRMHQFDKVELVSITTPEQSNAEHERMTDAAQNILKKLNLHHRVVTLCAGDMGFGAKKTYDIEVWLPGQGRFREISSCSNCGDFQARRMNTRVRGKDGKVKGPAHTLNGSGLAIGRTLIAIMENFQQPDGSIAVPDALQPYMGGQHKIAAAQ